MSEKGAAQRNGPAPHSDILAPFGKKRLVWGGKTKKKSAKFFLRLHDTHKMYILQKNWTKTVNPALSSGLNFFPPPIWGHHHQLDDHQRNPNMNNRDHLVGQLTKVIESISGSIVPLAMFFSALIFVPKKSESGHRFMKLLTHNQGKRQNSSKL